MSVASLNIYHHGKHHRYPVPKWIARLFFIILPKLLFMNIELPVNWRNRRESLLQCMVEIFQIFFFIFSFPCFSDNKKSKNNIINIPIQN